MELRQRVQELEEQLASAGLPVATPRSAGSVPFIMAGNPMDMAAFNPTHHMHRPSPAHPVTGYPHMYGQSDQMAPTANYFVPGYS